MGCEFMKIFLGLITDNIHAYLLLSMREVVLCCGVLSIP